MTVVVGFGALSLSDLQQSIDTGRTATAADRIDEIIGYATLAERLPPSFGRGEGREPICHCYSGSRTPR
jgi:hypothetical protein